MATPLYFLFESVTASTKFSCKKSAQNVFIARIHLYWCPHLAETMYKYRFSRNLIHVVCLLASFVLGILLHSLITGSCEPPEEIIDDHNYLLVVLIVSAPQNVERRGVIRDTWLNLRPKQVNSSFYQNEIIYIPKLKSDGFIELESIELQRQQLKSYQEWLQVKVANIKVSNFKLKHFFAIGTEGLNANQQKLVQDEQAVYSDLLLLPDLQDSYRNLSTKVIKSFQKIAKNTINFKYLLKCDDDTYTKLDLVALDLLKYEEKKTAESSKQELYWGYFHGRARIKSTGHWQEVNYHLCERYLPYALGGGYVLSKKLVQYVTDNGDVLSKYISEDVSMGTWLAPLGNVHRRHDVRFDTAYLPRACKPYHIVLHKRTANDMLQISKGNMCYNEVKLDQSKLPVEYFYDWTKSPLSCCDMKV